MKVRNINPLADGRIDCEINLRGEWITYTTSPHDPDTRGQKIHTIVSALHAGEEVPHVGDDVLQPPTAEEILRRARVAQVIDKAIFARMLRQVDLWAPFKAALAEAGEDAQEDWDLASSVSRMDPVFVTILSGLGLTPEQIDLVFGIRLTAE